MEPIKCATCSKEFKSQKALKLHQRFEALEAFEKGQSLSPTTTVTTTNIPVVVSQGLPQTGMAHVIAPPVVKPVDYKAYKQLPPPIVTHLEKTWGGWLDHIEIGQISWRKDFGGPGIFIKVPAAFSTEIKEVTVTKYDNATRKQLSETKAIQEDIRCCPLKEINEALKWIDKVKEHIVVNAFKKGLQLPTTGLRYESPTKSLEEYKRELAGV